jgi:hypothetical protein
LRASMTLRQALLPRAAWRVPSFARFVALSASLAVAAASARMAVASPPTAEDRAAAQALFEEAGALYRAGKFAEACPKLATSQRLDPALGTLLNLGRCYEKIGLTVSAWLAYVDAATTAKNGAQPDRERTAREAAARLAPLLPRLVVVVAAEASAPGLEVKRDGVSLSPGLWNQGTPIDPGDHLIAFSAPGKRSRSAKVHAEPAVETTVTAPVLEDSTTSLSTTVAEPPPSARLRTGAWVAAGVGVVGIGLGSLFGVNALSDKASARRSCTNGICTDQMGQDASVAAHSHAVLSTIFLGTGVAAIVGAVVLYRLSATASPRPSEVAAETPLRWGVTLDGEARSGILSVSGAWW